MISPRSLYSRGSLNSSLSGWLYNEKRMLSRLLSRYLVMGVREAKIEGNWSLGLSINI